MVRMMQREIPFYHPGNIIYCEETSRLCQKFNGDCFVEPESYHVMLEIQKTAVFLDSNLWIKPLSE